MTIARVSRGGRSEDLQSLDATTESERHDKDELENDADHKELVSAYGCEDYLLRWLPNIGDHEHVSHATTKPSQCEERRDKEEQLCTTPVPSEAFLKSTSRYHQTKETDVYISSGNKIFQQPGRLTYFEAIKCSPMKLRQSITTHKRPNVSSLIVSQQHFQKPVKERVPTSKYRSPVFEITQHPVRQLGSLCFQTKNSVRRPSEATYSSIRLVGGKISTSRRNAHYKTVTRKGSELRVRCESVMIYPKTLIPPGNEKPSKKPTKPRKEAWRETSSVPAAVQSDEDCTKLPHLGVKKSETSEEKQNRKLSPELEGSSKAEQEQKQNSSNRSAAMKIVIPFGEDQEPHETVEGFGKLLRPATLKPEVLGRKSSQATSKVYYEQNSRKKGEHFYDNQKEYNPNSQEKSRRITSMVITQLGTPRKTLCNNPSFASETPNVPLSKIRTGTADTNGLFLGRENLLRQRAGARFSYNQRSRAADLGTQNKGRVLPERIDHEGGKCFLSTESGGSLTIGGTGLLKKQRRLHENFGKGEEIKDTGEQPGYFRNSLPHSHYIM